MPRHIILAGDSIFDNAAYIDGAPDVAAQLRSLLLPEDTVTLRAIDGSISDHVHAQLADLPGDATHLIISSGGNDILHHAALLEQPADTVASAMAKLAAASAEFAQTHRRLVEAAAALDMPTAFCTIYDANMGPLIATAMGIFNDAITRNIHAAGCDVVDLRLVTTMQSDYANPIEPSCQGGSKIAAVLKNYADSVCEKGHTPRVFC